MESRNQNNITTEITHLKQEVVLLNKLIAHTFSVWESQWNLDTLFENILHTFTFFT